MTGNSQYSEYEGIAYNAVVTAETSDNASSEYQLVIPNAGQNSGVSIGPTQFDFSRNEHDAGLVLQAGLLATGQYTLTEANNIAQAIHTAGSGAVD